MERTHSFGYWVRRQRKALDLSQRDLAERAACSLSTIKKIEQDTRRPSRELAEILADCLAVPVMERGAFLSSARGLAPVDEMPLASQPVEMANDEAGLRTTDGNLPAAVGLIFGRDEELARLSDLIITKHSRLITLVGPGGVGKSRLALATARRTQAEFRDGAWLVPLAGIDDPGYLSTAVAAALELNFAGPLEPEQQLVRQLQERQLLLLLDNFEQLLPEGAEFVSTLIQRVPGLTLLVTSRERLRLQAEMTIPVGGLRPEPARVLFTEQAQRAGIMLAQDQTEDTSNAVDEICSLVGGLPLAVELASAWIRLLSPAEILADLRQSLGLLSSDLHDLPQRQRSITAVFEGSWKRLAPEERKLLARLTVFPGSFTRDAAESICGATLSHLAALHDHSLIQRDRNRFSLHEVVRQSAAQKIDDGLDGLSEIRAHHAVFYIEFLGRLSDLFKTGGAQLTGWERMIDREMDNIRISWHWMLSHNQPQRLLPALLALWNYQDYRGLAQEGLQMATELDHCAIKVQAEHLADDDPIRRIRAMALLARTSLGMRIGQAGSPREKLMQMTSLLDGLQAPNERVAMIGLLGPTAMLTMDAEEGQAAIEELLHLARREGHVWGQGLALNFMGLFLFRHGHAAQAKDRLDEALAIWSKHPGFDWCRLRSMVHLGLVQHALGDFERAQSIQEEALQLAQELQDISFIPLAYCNLAFHYYADDRLEEAEARFGEGLLEAQRFDLIASVKHSIAGLGLVAAAKGLAGHAVTLLTAGTARPSSYIGFLLGEPQRVLAGLRSQLTVAQFKAAENLAQEMELHELIAWL